MLLWIKVAFHSVQAESMWFIVMSMLFSYGFLMFLCFLCFTPCSQVSAFLPFPMHLSPVAVCSTFSLLCRLKVSVSTSHSLFFFPSCLVSPVPHCLGISFFYLTCLCSVLFCILDLFVINLCMAIWTDCLVFELCLFFFTTLLICLLY